MTKQWVFTYRSRYRKILDAMPADGCLIVFNVQRTTLQSWVSKLGLTPYLEVHKISPEIRSRKNFMDKCDVYVGWRE